MSAQQNPAAEASSLPRFPAAHRVLLEAIDDHAFPGAAYGILLGKEVLAIEGVGRFTYDPSALLIRSETVFDLASVSKVVATTAMAMLLCERGVLDLNEPIAKRLPVFVGNEPADSLKRIVTARMLLAHSSGLPAYARLFESCPTAQALLDACLRMPLEVPPETRAVYSDIGFIVLGHVLETLAQERLDTFCQREIFAPLGMSSTLYCPPQALMPAIAPTAIDDVFRHRLLQGEVHDENCWVLGGISGHAGVFSNVADTLRFASCILRRGLPLFQPETIALFTARQGQPLGTSRALGWDTPSVPSSSGQFFSAHSVGHLGYTGTSLWIDLEKDLAVTLLTNRTFPGNGPNEISKQIQQTRPRFHDTLMYELGLDKAVAR